MTKDLMVIALGVWVAVVPFLGFPNRWDTIIFAVSGILIITLMLLLRRDLVRYVARIKSERVEKTEHVFEESTVPKHAEGDNNVPIKHPLPQTVHTHPSPPPHSPRQSPPPPHTRRGTPRKRLMVVNEDTQETHS